MKTIIILLLSILLCQGGEAKNLLEIKKEVGAGTYKGNISLSWLPETLKTNTHALTALMDYFAIEESIASHPELAAKIQGEHNAALRRALSDSQWREYRDWRTTTRLIELLAGSSYSLEKSKAYAAKIMENTKERREALRQKREKQIRAIADILRKNDVAIISPRMPAHLSGLRSSFEVHMALATQYKVDDKKARQAAIEIEPLLTRTKLTLDDADLFDLDQKLVFKELLEEALNRE